MSAILIISVFLLFAASFAILRTRRSRSGEDAPELPPFERPRPLFAGTADETPKETAGQMRRRELRERAEQGDLSALAEASALNDAAFYRLVLDVLVGRASGDAGRVRELSAHIARGRDLRASPELAEMLLGLWREEPTPSSTAELLRVSALSDDVGTFGRAVNEVLQSWEAGRLKNLAAEDLRTLFDAEHWLLSSEAKRSGEGFILKQKLADVRRRLTNESRPESQVEAGGRVLEEERPPP